MNAATDTIASDMGSSRATIAAYLHPQVAALLFLGFSAGLPLLLIFGTLSIWLTEAGVERAAVTYFSWAALGYSFKFVWAPLIDKLPLPFLTRRLGQRRAWMLVAQIAVMGAIAWMGFTDPAVSGGLAIMAIAAVALGFSSATQDIVIDAYRIEAAEESMQAMLSAAYVAGYRCGMLVGGAAALYLAAGFGTTSEQYAHAAWKYTYLCMAATMLVGIATTLVVAEPVRRQVSSYLHSTVDYARFLVLFALIVGSFVVVFVALGESVERTSEWLAGLRSARRAARIHLPSGAARHSRLGGARDWAAVRHRRGRGKEHGAGHLRRPRGRLLRPLRSSDGRRSAANRFLPRIRLRPSAQSPTCSTWTWATRRRRLPPRPRCSASG